MFGVFFVMALRPTTPQWQSQWDDEQSGEQPGDRPPNMVFVVTLLVLAAFTLAYLGSYAISSAMVKAELIKAWTPSNDPRPVWLMSGFFLLLGLFTTGLLVARHLSQRSMRQLERAEQEVLADG